MSQHNLPLRFLAQKELRPNKNAYATWSGEEWQYTSWGTYVDDTVELARALIALGIQPQDKLCILGFNKPQWSQFAMASLMIGAIPIGIYCTCSSEEIAHVLNHSEAKLVLVENDEYWQTIEALLPQCPNIERVIFMDSMTTNNVACLSWQQLLSHAQEVNPELVDFRVKNIQSDDLGTLIYTSGTTGPSKGVMLSHKNLFCMAETLAEVVKGTDEDAVLSYLPLCHIAEQMVTLHCASLVGLCVYYAESLEKVPDNLATVQPTIFFGVPRVWEKFYQGIASKLVDVSGSKKLMLSMANKVGKAVCEYRLANKKIPFLLGLRYRLFDRLIFSKLKAKLGLSRARICTSGGGPLALDILEWFTQFDIIIQEVYGQSEITGATTLNVEGATRLGSVGKALPGIELKISDDGEICVRGDCVFKGYYKDDKNTSRTIDAEGWMASGDLGKLDDEGYLYITGRKKEVIITAGGKNITPRNIEEALCKIEYINQAIVIGDKRRFLSALLTIDEKMLAETLGGDVPKNPQNDAKILELVEADVQKVNARFARVEHIRKFHLLNYDFSVESGELTPTLKVKRDFVAKKFEEEIEAMYR